MLALFLFTQFITHNPAFPQQPQAQAGQEIFPVNAKFVQGFGPGYWPTAGSNLTLNLAPGTAVCSNVVQTYAGGTLTLAPSATNYVYLNPANNCAPASNTTGFASASIPIATVVTSSTTISSINDVRTMFVSTGVTNAVTSVGMAGDGIIFNPVVSGSPITSSGTLAPQLLTQTTNTILAGPGSGPSATPNFRSLVPADLPATISSNTMGNAATATALASSPTQCSSNGWATGISASGNANCLQPTFTNLSGTATILQGGTGQATAGAAFNALSPLTTEGDLNYYHSSGNTRLAVGGNGQCLVSNGADPLWGSCSGSSSFAWSSLVNPAGSLTLSMSTYPTTFNHTSAANWTWANTTVATSSTSQSSPLHLLAGTYWNGSASATDSWSFQNIIASGTNGNSTLTLAHTGSTGTATLSVPNVMDTSTTQYGVLYGGGSTAPVKSTSAGASGLPLLGQGSAAPVFGTLGIAGGGTGQATASAAFNALSPLTTEGDLHYYHSSSNARLGVGANGQCLTSNGTDPVWGACGTGSGSSSGLGNGTTVIDATLEAGTDFSTKVNAAIAACSPGPCTFDLRGFSGNQTMSQSIEFPAGSVVFMPQATITRQTGAQFIISQSDVHIHGSSIDKGTIINSANMSNDYSAVFYSPTPPAWTEIDHIHIGNTTPSGPKLPLISSAAATACPAGYSGNCTTYTYATSTPSSANNAFVGMEFGVWGFANGGNGWYNDGYYICAASTATTLTTTNPYGWAQTGMVDAFATMSGGWGIDAAFIDSSLHDIETGSSLGVRLADSGCTCYDYLENLNLRSSSGALFVGWDAASVDANHITAWGTDQNNLGVANAVGYGVRVRAGGIVINGLDTENTKYPIVVDYSGQTIITHVYNEQHYLDQLGPVVAPTGLPLIGGGTGNSFPDVTDYVDLTPAGNNPSPLDVDVNGSEQINPVALSGYSTGLPYSGSGSTVIPYWIVGVDFNGNKTLPKAIDYPPNPSFGGPPNQALGPYSLTLTSVSTTAGVSTYTGTITGGASNGLANNTFTIAGCGTANNGAFTTTTSTASSLVVNNPSGTSQSCSSGSASSTASNIISINKAPGAKCYDVLKGDTAHSLATCVPFSIQIIDNGSIATQPYTAPIRNSTADLSVSGALSTANNTLDDGSGNMTVANGVTAPQFCVGSKCVTSLYSNPMTTLGDLLYGGASGAATRLGGNTSTTPMYLKSIGTGGAATAPTLAQIQFSDIAGTVPNTSLANSAVTVAGNTCTLGSSCAISLDDIASPSANVSLAFGSYNYTETYAGGNHTLACGTLTSSVNCFNLTATFNASGTTFTAPFTITLTNTASHAGSLMANFLGGTSGVTSELQVDTNGNISVAAGGAGLGNAIGSAVADCVWLNATTIEICSGGSAPTGNTGAHSMVFVDSQSSTGQFNFYSGPSSTNQTTLSGFHQSGSNTAGTDMTLATGIGTGNAAPPTLHLQTALAVASGSSAQTYVDRETITGKTYSLTSGSAASVYDIAFASSTLSAIAGKLEVGFYVTDGTHGQSLYGECPFSAVDVSGTITVSPSTATALVNTSTALSSGTLTATCTITTGSNLVHVQITPTSSLTTPTITGTVHLHQNSSGTVTVD